MSSPVAARWMPCVAFLLPLVLAAACNDGEAPNETTGAMVAGSSGGAQAAGSGNGGGAAGNGGSSAGQAGAAGSLSGEGGSSPLPASPQTRAYTLVPAKTIALGPYAMFAPAPPLHLRLTNDNGALSAGISADYGSAATADVVLDVSRALAEAPTPTQSAYRPEGPLSFDTGVSAGITSLGRIALDLDAAGISHRAIVRGRASPPGLSCTQNASGDDFVGIYDLVADTSGPLVGSATARLPWEDWLATNEPTVLPPSSDASLGIGGMAVRPALPGGFLARAGKTFTFAFPGLTDADGHASSPEASIAFRDLGPGVPAESFGDEKTCTSPENAAGFARLVAKPGATSVTLRLCSFQGYGQVVVRIQGETGEPVRQTIDLAQGGVTAQVPLPASPAALFIESAGCFAKIAGFSLE